MIKHLLIMIFLLTGFSIAADELEVLKKDTEAIAATPHRLFGTDESRQATDYIIKRLKDIGVENVIVQPFQVIQTKVKRCEML